MIDDDDIWTTDDPDPVASPGNDTIPADDAALSDGAGGGGFWSVGRVVGVLVVAVAVGVLAYWVASRGNDDDTVTASGDMAPSDQVPASDLWGRTWEVQRLEMGAEQPVQWSKGDTETPLDFDLTIEGEVRFTGCNGGAGPATYTDGIFQAQDLAGTMMACEGDEGAQLMAYDTWMANFLTDGVAVSFSDDGSLVLSGPEGTAWLSGPGSSADPDPSTTPGDTANPDAPVSSPVGDQLWGNRWEIRSIIPTDSFDGKPIVALADGTAPVIDTQTADLVTISGCNGTGGAVHLEGDTLVSDGPWMQTKMACEQELMDQEFFLTTFLEAGPTVSIADDLLTLSGDDWQVLAFRL